MLLVAFAIRTILKGRTRGEGEGKNWVKLTEKEIDELVDEFNPQPLVDIPTELDELTLPSVPIIQGPNGVKVRTSSGGKLLLNLASPNWTGLAENEKMKQVAIETLRQYGVGTCGPSGFYGTIGETAAYSGADLQTSTSSLKRISARSSEPKQPSSIPKASPPFPPVSPLLPNEGISLLPIEG